MKGVCFAVLADLITLATVLNRRYEQLDTVPATVYDKKLEVLRFLMFESMIDRNCYVRV